MKKTTWAIIILIILILFFIGIKSLMKSTIQVVTYGENIFTGKCDSFATPSDQPFYYKSSAACNFILTYREISELYNESKEESCNKLSAELKEKVFEKLKISSCKDIP
ncbi:MAG: hypothetical protein AABW80_03655 [Nanoarchaeota archaeon]